MKRKADPLNARYDAQKPPSAPPNGHDGGFCPYCDMPMQDDFTFCQKCGKERPKE